MWGEQDNATVGYTSYRNYLMKTFTRLVPRPFYVQRVWCSEYSGVGRVDVQWCRSDTGAQYGHRVHGSF